VLHLPQRENHNDRGHYHLSYRESEAAPFVYFDLVTMYGVLHGVIQIELASRVLTNDDGSVKISFLTTKPASDAVRPPQDIFATPSRRRLKCFHSRRKFRLQWGRLN